MRSAKLSSGKTHRDENFPVASLLIAKGNRDPILAFYEFVRAADDIADHPALRPELKLQLLNQLEDGLVRGDLHPEAARLRRVLAARGLSDRHARDLLSAFRLDATINRYATWSELMNYCEHSAMPVGRFVLDVHGEAESFWPASDAICAALQIINHLQDCRQDFLLLDRVYLPAEALAREGARMEDLAAPCATPALRAAIASLARRTSALLERGAELPQIVRSRRLSFEIEVILRLARRNVARLRSEDPLAGGGRTGKATAALLTVTTVTGALLRTAASRAKQVRSKGKHG